MEVIGYEIVNGIFEKEDGSSIPWEHVHLYVTQDIRNGEGKKTKFFKCKRDILPVPLNHVLHQRVKAVYYDEYKKKVAKIEFDDIPF